MCLFGRTLGLAESDSSWRQMSALISFAVLSLDHESQMCADGCDDNAAGDRQPVTQSRGADGDDTSDSGVA
jgi:hypothetical protein